MATTFLEPGSGATQDMSLFDVAFTTGAGTITSSTQAIFGGSRSIKCSETSGNNDEAHVDKACVGDSGRCSFTFRMSKDFDIAAADFWVVAVDSSNYSFALCSQDSPARIRLYSGATGSTITTGTTPIAGNTDYRITIAWNIIAVNNYTIKVWVDGVLDITATFATNSLNVRTGCTTAIWGWRHFQGPASTSFDLYFADIYVDDSSALTDPWNGTAPAAGKPQLGVTAKRPIANGTTNGFTTQIGSGGSGTGTGHSPQVNERPLSETNGWSMVGAGSAVTEEYAIQSASAGDVDISVQLVIDFVGWLWAKSLASETGSIIVAGSSSNISLTSTSKMFTKVAGSTTYPAGGTDIGIITTTALTTVSLYECGIIVAYQPNPSFAVNIGTSLAKVTSAINTIEPLTTNSPRLNAYFEHFWGGR